MIQKLRRKFILINMALVTLVLLIVFGALYFSSYQRMRGESFDSMRRIIGRNAQMPPPKFEIGDHRPKDPAQIMPVFCVLLDDSGEIQTITRDNVEVSDEVVADAVKRVKEAGKDIGALSGLGLRYLRADTPEGTKIAFADLSNERSAMASLLLTSLLVGFAGLAAFFLISLFLAGWALRPVEQAWTRQRQFVADASHELKTPLTVILANTEILVSHKTDPIEQQMKWVEYIRAEADRMKKLVEDMLFLAKSDAARAPLQRIPVNFSDTVWNCLLPFEPVAFEQGVELDSEIEPGILLSGDEGQLKQLVMILLDNACKYAGENGTVKVTAGRLADKVRLSVHNTGALIPQEDLKHLFERFFRVDKARARDQGGFGLGLAIAKSIVDGYRGKLSVESSEEKGTTFTVTLPFK
ncbi:MAG: two-component sensor histidine kinase [Ruminococcaceae bacterium]|nr:two-component sensor histidine kinase [Oscillospiraceae bacterium]